MAILFSARMVCSVAVFALAGIVPVSAQYPERNITLIVPYGAGTVFYRHRLSEHCFEVLRQHARGDIGAAAGAIRYDQRDVAFRILS